MQQHKMKPLHLGTVLLSDIIFHIMVMHGGITLAGVLDWVWAATSVHSAAVVLCIFGVLSCVW